MREISDDLLNMELGISHRDGCLCGRVRREMQCWILFRIFKIAKHGGDINNSLLGALFDEGNQCNCEKDKPDDIDPKLSFHPS